MKKIFFLIIAIFGLSFSSTFLFAQHLFSVSYNDVSKENVTLLKNQITRAEIATLSLAKNNVNRNVYPVGLSSAKKSKIIILNEQTGNNVTISPADESLAEFQLAPFFIEELRQGVLGNASHYLLIEATSDFSVNSVSSVSAIPDVFIPQYFYGSKENVREALPKDRQIVDIFKQTPRLIPADPNDPENLRYVAQLEEEMSYYMYIFKLPDGTLCTYDEHFNPDNSQKGNRVGENLAFILSGNLTGQQITATEYALELWGDRLSGQIPVDINVMFVPMGPGVLGGSYRMPQFLNSGQVPGVLINTWYPSPLWNQLVGYDATGQRDIRIEMNSNYSFYFGITGNPSYSQTDWVTVMLHEACHGFGFYPLCDKYGAFSSGTYPGIFDRQLFQGLTGLCITELSQADRAALMTSGNLYAGAPGSLLLTANEGNRVKMYAPSSYQDGSSTSHWDNSVTFTTFMKYAIGNGASGKIHTISTRELGILLDLGWTEPIFDPNASWVTFMPNGGTGSMAKQQFLPGEAQNLRTNDFKRDGYTYTNWNTAANGTGASYSNQQSVTLPGNTDITLYAQWEANTYTLTFNPGTGGTVNPTSKQVVYDQPIGEMPIPERPGYSFVNWRYGATPITEATIWNYAQNITVTAGWQAATYIITATTTSGGTISPSGDVSVNHGSNRTFAITPDEDYEIVDVLVDDKSVGKDVVYTFTDITGPHTIHAVFQPIVGIAETPLAASIQIVPNPASHTVELRITNYELRIDCIEFYNIFGQVVKSVPVAGETNKDVTTQKINISDLSAGVYVVKAGGKAAKLVVK